MHSFVPTPPRDYKPSSLSPTTKFDHKLRHYTEDRIYYPLERQIIFPLNKCDRFVVEDDEIYSRIYHPYGLVKGHMTNTGILFVFDMTNNDVIQLNSLLYDLTRLHEVQYGAVHYFSTSSDTDPAMNAFPFDKDTRMFNRFRKPVGRCDYIDMFEGYVSLSINGLFVVDGCHVFLDVTVHQVMIDTDLNANYSCSSECIF